ncbi:MAG: hypothetical protein NUV80_00965 [Candidatus Berkelbacteria bacterium]|nr:hypothetical protein [Candidatus Berkelbacteria bacterium]
MDTEVIFADTFPIIPAKEKYIDPISPRDDFESVPNFIGQYVQGTTMQSALFRTDVENIARMEIIKGNPGGLDYGVYIVFKDSSNARYASIVGDGSSNLHIHTVDAGGIAEVNQNEGTALTCVKAGVIVGQVGSALATTATDGFLYIPTSAGLPTGVPTAATGHVALEYDTTNDNLKIYNGSWKTVGARPKLDIVTTDVVVSNTAVETTLWSKTVPGGTLGTNNGIHVKLFADVYGSLSESVTFRIKYGATTMLTITEQAANVGSPNITLDFYLLAAGATNAQKMFNLFMMHRSDGDLAGSNDTPITSSGADTAAEDSTLDKTLAVTVDFITASASNNITVTAVVAEIIQ